MVDGNYSDKQVSLFVTYGIFICLFSKKLLIYVIVMKLKVEVFELKSMSDN